MTGSETTSKKNNGNEEVPPDDEHLLQNDRGLIYKTEITIAVNESGNNTEGNEEDLVILRNDNNTVINRSAYSKLHKVSSSRLSTFSLGRFELFSNSQKKTSGPDSGRAIGKKGTNLRIKAKGCETKQSDDETIDFVPCVIRKSDSLETVDRIEKELSNFIMDNKKKDKKRTNSFRKLFSVSLFGKDKKKKAKETESNNSPSSDYVENYQNETHSNSFIRNTPQRHTVSCDHFKKEKSKPLPPKNIEEDPPPEILRKYANNHIQRFNKIRQSFECPDDNLSNIKNEFSSQANESSIQHSHVIKYIDTSSSATSTMESEKFNTYQNALIAQAELQQLKKGNKLDDNRPKLARNDSLRRDTPPRATDTYQPVNIVKPRARLPINSGRPLPNPYHNEMEDPNNKYVTQSSENEEINRPELLDTYGTVFDAIDKRCSSNRTSTITSQDSRKTQSPVPKSPRSPSLEGTKLRLPSNRDTTPLQPRLRSPLPSVRVSTEKIIATELLKNTNSLEKKSENIQTPSNTQPHHTAEKLFVPQAESTPDMKTCQALNALREKFEENSQKLNEELDQIKQTLQNISHEDLPDRTPSRNGKLNKETISNPTSSPRGTLLTSPRSSMTISPLPHNKQLEVNCTSPQPEICPQFSPDVELRQKHPVVRRNASQNNVNRSPSSPNKDEIRKSVEAYYWKEIKRIKEQEDYEIYLSQLHFSQKGYAEDPILTRRSRGIESNRGRRSSSVPRNPKQYQYFDQQNVNIVSTAIPEGNAVAYKMQDGNIYGSLHTRDSRSQSLYKTNSQRQSNGDYGTYKPIFRRGSLSGGGSVPQTLQSNKKVSFSNSQQPENIEAWPTRNGFTRSPPQRRLERVGSYAQLEDDVFLPPIQQQTKIQHQQIYGHNQGIRNIYNSDNESMYSQNVYGYAGQPQITRPNYNSDSETIYGGRFYRTLSRQEMENLRNAQANSARQPELRSRPAPRLTRHESIQLPESPYGYAVHYGGNRQYQTNNIVGDNRLPMGQSRISPRREILITDNIYGQHMGYRNDSISSPYGYVVNKNPSNISEPLYASRPKQVTVRNKVCDMYGRIHDTGAMSGGIQASGVLMGQIQDLPTSPQSFRRGTRLTSSNNDMMYRRQNNYQLNDNYIEQQNEFSRMHLSRGSVRPLPPLPPSGKAMSSDNRNANVRKTNSSKKKKK